jgi:hypothetical protein
MENDKKSRRPSINCGFGPEDITSTTALLNQLQTQAGPLCPVLLRRLSPGLRQSIARFSGSATEAEALKPALAAELSEAIKGGPLFHPTLFPADSLRPMTQAVLARRPVELDLLWLNKLLVQEAFPTELSRKSETVAAQWEMKGIPFCAYCEARPLINGWGLSYRVSYTGGTPKHAKSLEEALAKSEELAEGVLKGAPAPNRKEAKVRDAKAEAYDEICTEAAELGLGGAKTLFRFIRDAVAAQVLLGPERPLGEFVTDAVKVMPEPTQRTLLRTAFGPYQAFIQSKTGVGKDSQNVKLSAVRRYVLASAACEKVATQLAERAKLTSNCAGSQSAPTMEELTSMFRSASQAPEILTEKATANGILIWLQLLQVDWKQRRDCLDAVRNFFTYMRDVLHAVPQTAKTAAHLVARPKREAKKEPAAILWAEQVWNLLLNAQDLESVWFVAIGVFAGLHETAILRLDWEHDIIEWDGQGPTKIYIAPGKEKETQGAREGRDITIQSPLKEILALGKGRTGSVITNKKIWYTKIRPLVQRLGILWKQSIMRHTCASLLKALGVALKDVADQLGDREGTVKRYYLQYIPPDKVKPFQTPPVDLSRFAKLPPRLREWDWRRPLLEVTFSENGQPSLSIRPPEETAPLCPKKSAPAPNGASRKRGRRVGWPPDEVMRVLVQHLLV